MLVFLYKKNDDQWSRQEYPGSYTEYIFPISYTQMVYGAGFSLSRSILASGINNLSKYNVDGGDRGDVYCIFIGI